MQLSAQPLGGAPHLQAKPEICVEPVEIPTDREAVVRETRARQPASPADTVRKGLALFNLAHVGELHAPLHAFLRDPDAGETYGGILGRTGRGALYIEHAWIAEAFRRQRYGSRLLAAVEAEARARGCRFAHVETYSFHGTGFYERNGYTIFARLPGFSGGHTRFYLRKDLALEPRKGAA